ncbi:MAG: hypothetical protein H7141_13225 [Burkholderiales bacterium]|nr:hypothetical protein [Bacteroidia bacterium]
MAHESENKIVMLELTKGILVGTYLTKFIDLKMAQSTVIDRMKLYGDKDYPLLIHINNVQHVTKDARDYFASKEACQKIKSCAIITNSIVTRVIANFFLTLNKPLVPTKLFTNVEHAKEWLSN